MPRLLYSKFTHLFFLGIFAFFLILIARMLPTILQNNRRITTTTAELDQLQKAQNESQDQLAYLNSDAYLERQARIKLNYKKPNETVVFVYKSPYNQNQPSALHGGTSLSASSASDAPASLPHWRQWLNYLLNR